MMHKNVITGVRAFWAYVCIYTPFLSAHNPKYLLAFFKDRNSIRLGPHLTVSVEFHHIFEGPVSKYVN